MTRLFAISGLRLSKRTPPFFCQSPLGAKINFNSRGMQCDPCVVRFSLTLLCCAVCVSLGGESPTAPGRVDSGDAKSTAKGMQCVCATRCNVLRIEMYSCNIIMNALQRLTTNRTDERRKNLRRGWRIVGPRCASAVEVTELVCSCALVSHVQDEASSGSPLYLLYLGRADAACVPLW